MTTRLERLVTLLETGSTQLIRNTAAQQLADIQKKHPDDLFNLLTKVVPYLKAKSWDTRIAAAKAVGGIIENAEKFDPNLDDLLDGHGLKSEDGVKSEEVPTPTASDDQLQLETLDAVGILTHGKKLLGSAGKEYDYFLGAMDPAQRLAHQKKSLTARLGLGGEYTEEDLIDEGDLRNTSRDYFSPNAEVPKINTAVGRSNSVSWGSDSPFGPPTATPTGDGDGKSKRQLNAMKRKAKKELKDQASKVRVVDFSANDRRPSISQATTPHPTAVKQEPSVADQNGTTDYFSLDRPGGDDETKMVTEFKGPVAPGKSELQPDEEEEGVEWPFERLTEFLMVDMFDHNWEVRHGATMGIREIVRVHGACAGREMGKSRAQNDKLNQTWLNDLACRLCCIFMLDRFGDYVSDNVVAPIRETAGQALGAVLQHLSPSAVEAVYHILYRLVMQNDFGGEKRVWQACHGGMIGMRYLVAVRHDLLLSKKELMDGVLEVVMQGLGDWDDDVRAVSAATLIPVSQELIDLRPSALGKLMSTVWDCLSNLSDDLSASTGSVMDLLAKLCSFPEVLEVMKSNAAQNPDQSFANLVPRLYPFLRHTITGVRSAVLRALQTFLGIHGEGVRDWIDGRIMRLIFQNLLVERNEQVLKSSLQVWTSLVDTLAEQDPAKLAAEFTPHLQPLITLTMNPIGVSRFKIPMEPTLFIRPSGQVFVLPITTLRPKSPPKPPSEPPVKKRRKSIKERSVDFQPVLAHNIDGPMIEGDIDLVGADVMIRSKTHAAKALGKIMSCWPTSSRLESFEHIKSHIFSPNSSTRVTAAMVVEEYGSCSDNPGELGAALGSSVQKSNDEELPAGYQDVVSYLRSALASCNVLYNTFESAGKVPSKKLPSFGQLVIGEESAGEFAFTMQHGEKFVGDQFDEIKKSMNPAQRITSATALDQARTDAKRELEEAKAIKEQRDIRVRAAASAAVVALNMVPKKPSATIKAVMDSIKLEENSELQRRSATAAVTLIRQLAANKKVNIIEKVMRNIVTYYTSDSSETPTVPLYITLENRVLSLIKEEDVRDVDTPDKQKAAKAARTARRGAKEALEGLAMEFGPNLLKDLPMLETTISKPLKDAFSGDLPQTVADPEDDLAQQAVDAMSVLRALIDKFDSELHHFVLGLLPLINNALKSKLSVLRYAAAKCLASVCSVITIEGFEMLVKEVVPSINHAHDIFARQGAIECIYHLIHVMEDRILPYVIFLIVPVLGRMSDSDADVRLIATTTFATLVKLVPLEAGIPDPPGLSEELLQGRERERQFMSQMLDLKKIENFEIPVAINAQLRSYQQDGVNWLAFLNRYNLHGVLCDDMGLGKTLQTLCIVASDHYLRAEKFAETGNPEVRKLPSLIICPPTLTGHWQQEIKQYAPFLNAVAYVGPPAERKKAKAKMDTADVIITSYEICRNEIDVLAPRNWNYCVLDEGHLIKNPAAKTTLAVKRLSSYHRLILSGTPIQNNVLELWSLFDFLMPGFLGTEKVFKDRFAKPIAASRFSKSSSKEQEAGALAIEALHKQVLPFLLRRLKEEVLDDLPPKILQNYYCDLSDLQKKLFEDFTKKEGKTLSDMAASGDKESKQHIFTALNYMRKLCNSPALVMKEGHKQYAAIQKYLQRSGSSIRDPAHAPKLFALRDLLVDCGIGVDPTEADNEQVGQTTTEAVSQHRALIFCQMKEMLDIVQNDVLKKMLPSTTFLRLDGSTEAARRQDIVNKFNNDPSYDCLLLTTSVGGLGLNLTGADTVIFVEHDWNPQKDIQAMDRAHRIGQKKVVNVYRLITRGTLEEKIMSLQRFKIDVASTVVNQQNSGVGTMDTTEILDLFNLGETADGEGERKKNGDIDGADAVDEVTGEVREKGKKGFLDELGELWDEQQYEEEYNLDDFLSKMKA